MEKAGYSGMFTTCKQIGLWLYFPDISKSTDFWISLYSEAVGAKYFSYKINYTYKSCRNGWNWVVLNSTQFTNNNGAVWADIQRIKFRMSIATGETASFTLGGVYVNPDMTPKLIINFDDCYDSVYTKALPMFTAAGVRGTFYVVQDMVGDSGMCTLAQLQAIYAAGWDICNHTLSHAHLSTLTVSEIEAEVGGCTDWLLAQGFTRSAYHLSYPYGERSKVIIDTVADLGILTARTTGANMQFNNDGGLLNIPRVLSLGPTTTAQNMYDAVDELIKYGGTGFIFGHIIADDPDGAANTGATSVLQALIDYAKARKLEMVSVTEWYNQLTNPRYSAVPAARAAV
jgi:peptidoglycan/xylan/chitin deacetylase (PgdA/CDA1 family)